MLVDDDAAVVEVKAGIGGEMGSGRTPVAETMTSPSITAPVSRWTWVLSMSVTAVDPSKRTPLSDRIFATRSPTSTPNRRCSGTGSAATMVVGTPRPARQAAASQPISPAPITTAESAVRAAIRRITASANDRRLSAASAPGMRSGTELAPQASTRCQYG
jgi:hypothetical protein